MCIDDSPSMSNPAVVIQAKMSRLRRCPLTVNHATYSVQLSNPCYLIAVVLETILFAYTDALISPYSYETPYIFKNRLKFENQ